MKQEFSGNRNIGLYGVITEWALPPPPVNTVVAVSFLSS